MPAPKTPSNKPRTWLTRKAAARLAEVQPTSIDQIAAAGGVRRMVLPGRRGVRFHAEDMRRLIERSIVGAAPDPAAA